MTVGEARAHRRNNLFSGLSNLCASRAWERGAPA